MVGSDFGWLRIAGTLGWPYWWKLVACVGYSCSVAGDCWYQSNSCHVSIGLM